MIHLSETHSPGEKRMMLGMNDPSYDVGLRVGREEAARVLLDEMMGAPRAVCEAVLEEMVRMAAGDPLVCPTGSRLAREDCAFAYVSAAFGDWRHE